MSECAKCDVINKRTGYCPLALLDHGSDSLGDTRVGLGDILGLQR